MKRTFRDYVEDILTSFEETQEFTYGMKPGPQAEGSLSEAVGRICDRFQHPFG